MEEDNSTHLVTMDAAGINEHQMMSTDFVMGYVTGIALILFTAATFVGIRFAMRWYCDPEARPTILHRTKRHECRDFPMAKIKPKTRNRSKKPRVTSVIVSGNVRVREHVVGAETSSSPKTIGGGTETAAVVDKSSSVASTIATASSEPKATKMLKMSLTHDIEAKGADNVTAGARRPCYAVTGDTITGCFIGFFAAVFLGLIIFLFQSYRHHPEMIESDDRTQIAVQRRSVDFFENLATVYERVFRCIPWSPEKMELLEGFMGLIVVAVLAFMTVYRCALRVFCPERRRAWSTRETARYYVDRQKISGE